jgi:S-methylmethionine-dependent homocysteine/selenocysteine methylase
MVTDGGMETDFIFHHGVDLPRSPPSRWSTTRRGGRCWPALAIVGGCCGTDARPVSALWN